MSGHSYGDMVTVQTQFTQTQLDGVIIIEPKVFGDERGFFYESYHQSRFVANGVTYNFVQDNHSRSAKGVLRGVHYQDMRAPLAKLVRCTLGRILDVAVDLRVGSPTLGQWVAVELSTENAKQLLVPVGFGHAFLTLSDFAEVQYKCSNYYAPETEGAIMWNDPDLAIAWGVPKPPILSKRDAEAMSFKEYLQNPKFVYEEGRLLSLPQRR